jgi:hypothetical protein
MVVMKGKIGILFILLTVPFVISCELRVPVPKILKSDPTPIEFNGSTRYIKTRQTSVQRTPYDPNFYNGQLKSTFSPTLEESIFLEDVSFELVRDNKNKIIAQGRKLFTKNNVTSVIFPFDSIPLMGQKGECRAKLINLMVDLNDDGILNNSAGDSCMQDTIRASIGDIGLQETSFISLEDWNGDDFKDALFSFLNACRGFESNGLVKSQTLTIGTKQEWFMIIQKMALKMDYLLDIIFGN